MKISILTIFLFISVFVSAQQGLQMELFKPDSAQIELEKQELYRQLIAGEMAPSLLMEDLKLQDFDFNSVFQNRYKLNQAVYPQKGEVISGYNPGMTFNFNTPIHIYGEVFSSAAHQISDKLVLGGFSYGANSVFSSPLPNRGMNGYDVKGSTLFMQYKVSKNFKIETRVNVNSGGHGPGF